MVLERRFELWELGAFFEQYWRRVVGEEPPAGALTPPDAALGLQRGDAVLERPAARQTPTGLATWSRRGAAVDLDFVYTTVLPADRRIPRGAELVLAFWGPLTARRDVGAVRCTFTRHLVGCGEDFLSPLAARLGMRREDDVLLARRLDGPVVEKPFPKGFTRGGWTDAYLDQAIKVLQAAPDPVRLGEWGEQLCRDEILWAASGNPSGFGDGRAVTAWREGRLAGVALAASGGWVTQVHVRPEHQNKGLGLALVTALAARLRENGEAEATAMVGQANGEGRRLFERAGFVEEVRYPTWEWTRQPLNLSGVDLRWNGRMTRDELVDLHLRCGSAAAFDPARLAEAWRRSKVRLVARQRGELLGAARALGDGATTMVVVDLLVDPAVRFQGLGRLMVEALVEEHGSLPRLLFAGAPGASTFAGRVGLSPSADGAFVAPRA